MGNTRLGALVGRPGGGGRAGGWSAAGLRQLLHLLAEEHRVRPHLQYSTVQYSTVQYSTIQYSAV